MSKEIKLKIIEEQEANKFVAMSTIAWTLMFVLIEVLTELGVYYLEKNLIRMVTLFSFVIMIIAIAIAEKNKHYYDARDKYVLMTLILLQAFACLTTMTFHALLSVTIPIILSSYYRSRKLILCTVIISVLIIPFAFWLSVVVGSYASDFLAFLVYLVKPELISEGQYDFLNSGATYLKSPIEKIIFFVGIPNMMVNSIVGLMAIAVFMSRESNHKRQIEEIENIQDSVTMSMSVVVENRDENTGGHVKRTSDVMKIFVEELKKNDKNHNEKYWETIIKTAPLHDLGKVSIDDSILKKPAKLTDEEFAIIKTHPVKSAILIENVLGSIEDEEYVTIAKNIGKYHHERWNGKGYPEGLKGEEIPYEARIMTYVDVLDALVSERSYKKPFSFEEAFEIIKKDCGTMFDPNLFPAFESAYPSIIEYYRK